MSDIKTAYGTGTASTGGINSLATSSDWTAGYEWFVIDNTTALAWDYFVQGYITVGTTPTINTQIRIYLVGSYDGTTWPDVFDGTPSAETNTSAGVRDSYIKLAAVLKVDSTTSDRAYPFEFSVRGAFGGSLPKKIAVFVTHNTGVNLNATAGNQVYAYMPEYATVDGNTESAVGGGVAHDGVDSGNPVKIGSRSIASLASATIVSAADRSDALSDLDGAILVRQNFPLGDLVSERTTNTDGASTAFTNFGATASVRNYVTAISLWNSSATAGYVDFRDGTAGSILFTVPIPAGGGSIVCNGGVPLFRTSANTALAFDVSAALTTVYISVSGFRSKV